MPENPLPPGHGSPDSTMPALLAHWRQQRDARIHTASVSLGMSAGIASTAAVYPPSIRQLIPDLLIQAEIIVTGGASAEGQLVIGVSIAWFEIVAQLERDPLFLHSVPWRKVEELVAGAYEREGCRDVVLTPSSGDGGVDIIATWPGVGAIRLLDQIKAYAPHRVVTANDVRAMLGVLATKNASKGIVTTTSRFAPGIESDSGLQPFIPYRLELKDGPTLSQWLIDVRNKHR